MSKHTQIEARIVYNPDNPTSYSHLGFEVATDDGTDLTSQQILDAISDLLINIYPLADEPESFTKQRLDS